jgi:hypothetical protein
MLEFNTFSVFNTLEYVQFASVKQKNVFYCFILQCSKRSRNHLKSTDIITVTF